ncbi:MAG TPA: uroporphyrinogen-III synthase [Candidatus Polarisedimenticolaceae bacterium]
MSGIPRRVLVTRAPGAWPSLEAKGWTFRAPASTLPPLDPSTLARAIADLRSFAWVVLTSATGARRLAEALRAAGREPAALAAKVACVGPATARAAEGEGWRVAVLAAEGTGASLAGEIVARAGAGERVLVVRPESGSAFPVSVLEDAGLAVVAAAAYRTAPSELAPAIALELAHGVYEAVVFTAPSALQALLETAGTGDALAAVKRVAIGSTTAGALERAGLPAHAVAVEPTPEAVEQALESLW